MWKGFAHKSLSLVPQRRCKELLHLFPACLIGPKFLGDGLERGIKLHERVLYGCVIFVALPANLFRSSAGALRISVETEVCPLVGKARFVFYLNSHAHALSLEAAAVVDRAFRFRSAVFNDEHRVVWPLAALQKLVIGPLRHKNIGKHGMVCALWAVAHAQPGRKEDPLPVIGGRYEFIFGGELRMIGRRFGRSRQNCQTNKCQQKSESGFLHWFLPVAEM